MFHTLPFDYCDNVDAAEIVTPLDGESVTIVEGNSDIVTCIAVGHPPPSVEWSRSVGLISSRWTVNQSSMIHGVGNLTRVIVDLIMTNVSREDTGVYMCLASNPLNTEIRRVNITVECEFITVYKCTMQ